MRRPARLCIACGRVVAPGSSCPCRATREATRKAVHDARRPSAAARGYDADWRRIRAEFLLEHPRCSERGCDLEATDADHVLSVRKRPDLRLAKSNLRAFCHPHHSARTAREQSFGKGE